MAHERCAFSMNQRASDRRFSTLHRLASSEIDEEAPGHCDPGPFAFSAHRQIGKQVLKPGEEEESLRGVDLHVLARQSAEFHTLPSGGLKIACSHWTACQADHGFYSHGPLFPRVWPLI